MVASIRRPTGCQVTMGQRILHPVEAQRPPITLPAEPDSSPLIPSTASSRDTRLRPLTAWSVMGHSNRQPVSLSRLPSSRMTSLVPGVTMAVSINSRTTGDRLTLNQCHPGITAAATSGHRPSHHPAWAVVPNLSHSSSRNSMTPFHLCNPGNASPLVTRMSSPVMVTIIRVLMISHFPKVSTS